MLPDFMVGRPGIGFVGLGDLSKTGPGDGRFEDEASVGRILFLPVIGVLRDFAVLGRFIGVCGGRMVCGGRKVLVEALKSTSTELPEVLELELEVGLDIDCDGGLAGFSELKKLEPRLRTAGEDGIFCRVSIVRSDKDGLCFRVGNSHVCSSTGDDSSARTRSSCGRDSSRKGGSRRRAFEGFLDSALSLGFRKSGRTVGVYVTELVEGSRSRRKDWLDCRRTGEVMLRGREVEGDSCSLEAELRKRGLLMVSLEDCRFSRDAAGRNSGTRTGNRDGPGSLDGLGIPEGLDVEAGGSIVAKLLQAPIFTGLSFQWQRRLTVDSLIVDGWLKMA